MTQARAVTATFNVLLTPGPYLLTVIKAGAGKGYVVSATVGINCGDELLDDCSEVYPAGTPVTLTAIAISGSSFAGWSGACAGVVVPSCTVTMSQALTVTATFNSPTAYFLTVLKQGTGSGTVTITAPGFPQSSCSNPTCPIFGYPPSTQVTLTAAPASGSIFAGWGGGWCSGTGPCVITMNSDKTVIATFGLLLAQ
jgi:hypothetical protein